MQKKITKKENLSDAIEVMQNIEYYSIKNNNDEAGHQVTYTSLDGLNIIADGIVTFFGAYVEPEVIKKIYVWATNEKNNLFSIILFL